MRSPPRELGALDLLLDHPDVRSLRALLLRRRRMLAGLLLAGGILAMVLHWS